MTNELQELRDLVHQLQAEKEQLLQEQVLTTPSQPDVGSAPGSPVGPRPSVCDGPPPSERLLYIPRERRCPIFRGTSGIPVEDWIEEVEATLRARQLKSVDQAYFIYDHLEGEAKDEIRYRPRVEREDPKKIVAILRGLYGCSKSYVALQQSFFSRGQQEGESLQEFSHALCCLMEKIERCAPRGMASAPTLLRDQFVEHVLDFNLRRELKRMVRQHPDLTLLDVRAEAIRWEREGRPEEPRGRSYSVPTLSAMQCSGGVVSAGSGSTEMAELKHMLQRQQEQLNQLAQSLMTFQAASRPSAKPKRPMSIICRRCQKPGHYARECDNNRVTSQEHGASLPLTAPHTSQSTGNYFPLM